MTRAQTTVDFAIGISIFLVTVAFAFAFLPGVIAPFTDTDVGDPVSANRVADHLATDRLGSPDHPYVLNATEAAVFFDSDDALADTVAVPWYKSVNVTINRPDGDAVQLNATVTATAGPSVPDSADVTVAWRTVTVDGQRAELVVRVW
ncbi:MAG: hypothetical protein ABEH83_06165 [Halobacterium sp.]